MLNPAKIAVGTMDGALVHVNRAYAEFLGYAPEEMVGRSIAELGVVSPAEMARLLEVGKRAGAAMRDAEVVMRTRDGRLLEVLLSANIVVLDGVRYRVATLTDVTDRRRAERERNALQAQLWQAQKMESVGRLAGGIAHDFNNILTAINGLAGFALEGVPEGEQRAKDLKELLATSEKAAMLTQQLLAFSRRQVLEPQILDLNAAVGGMVKLLKRLIGDDVKLEARLARRPCLVMADASQIGQVVLNLAVNARDAMAGGGVLTIETEILSAPGEFFVRHPEMKAGPLARLTVRDTGTGMSDEVKARVFEPFYTTKEAGKGSGLGLSVVYGIVKQSGGEIEIESVPGRGAAVSVYLPQCDALRKSLEAESPRTASLQGDETLLFVEDQDILRRLAARVLTANGYAVLSAANGPEALGILERRGKPVDALITDVVMPGMSGRELARAVAKKRLARRILFVSGYTDDAIIQHGVLEPGLSFLSKPFTLDALLTKVRAVLDGPADQARA